MPHTIPFGKFADTPAADIAATDPTYLTWALSTDIPDRFPEFAADARAALDAPAPTSLSLPLADDFDDDREAWGYDASAGRCYGMVRAWRHAPSGRGHLADERVGFSRSGKSGRLNWQGWGEDGAYEVEVSEGRASKYRTYTYYFVRVGGVLYEAGSVADLRAYLAGASVVRTEEEEEEEAPAPAPAAYGDGRPTPAEDLPRSYEDQDRPYLDAQTGAPLDPVLETARIRRALWDTYGALSLNSQLLPVMAAPTGPSNRVQVPSTLPHAQGLCARLGVRYWEVSDDAAAEQRDDDDEVMRERAERDATIYVDWSPSPDSMGLPGSTWSPSHYEPTRGTLCVYTDHPGAHEAGHTTPDWFGRSRPAREIADRVAYYARQFSVYRVVLVRCTPTVERGSHATYREMVDAVEPLLNRTFNVSRWRP